MNRKIKEILISPYFRWLQQIRDKSIGSILILHRVNETDPDRLMSNEHLKISPEYLENLIRVLRKEKYSIVSIDDLFEVLKNHKQVKRLLVFTLDDGYRDNFENALPVFKTNSVPFTIYITTSFPEKQMIYWWYIIEDIILQNEKVVLNTGEIFECKSKSEKETAFLKIREKIIQLNPFDYHKTLPELFSNYNFESTKYNDTLPLSWEQIQSMSEDPLVTIGGHTHSHIALKYCSQQQIIEDINHSNSLFKSHVGIVPEHFCFPYGDSLSISSDEIDLIGRMGFKTAVTTDLGNIYLRHSVNLYKLPRIFIQEKQNPDLLRLLALMKFKNQ